MMSKAPDVPAYIQQQPAERQATLEKLRTLCRRNLRGYEEYMAHGMPCYKHDGALAVAFASQKNYIALYVMKKAVVDEFRGELAAASIGKGCIRFSRPERIDFAVIERMLSRTAESTSAPC
jgi:uncharacterized protein YdhG (YjbR/CyaY superfamily)